MRRDKKREKYATDPTPYLEANARWREKNREKSRQYQKDLRESVRREVLKEYGGECACCGEREPLFLTIDHINNDGAEHRRSLSPGGDRRGVDLALIVKREGFPKDKYRLLCYNCNCGRARNNGVCPHGN